MTHVSGATTFNPARLGGSSWDRAAAALRRLTRAQIAVAAAAIAIVCLHLGTLLRTPAPFVDEGWNANRAWAMVQTGRAFGTMDAGVFERYPGYWTFMPWLGTALHTPAIWLLGPSLFAMRLTSLVFGLLLLDAVYAIGNRLYGRRVGLLAAALTSLSGPFVYSAHLARHDVVVAAFGLGAIALCLAGDGKSLPLNSALAGLAAGLVLDIHPNGVIYGPVVAVLYLAQAGWSIPALLRARRFWSFLAGAGAGIAFFAAMHLRYPQTYVALAKLGPAPTRVPPLLSLDPGVCLQSMAGLLVFFPVMVTFSTPLAAAALLLLGRRRSPADRMLLVLFGAVCLAFALTVREKSRFYAVLITPTADLLAAVFLTDLATKLRLAYRSTQPGSRIAAAVTGGVALGLVGAGVGHSFAPALYDPTPDYRATVESIAHVVPAHASVMGPQTYWFGLPSDQRYLSWEQLIYYQEYAPGSGLEGAFRALRPDYFVVDTRMEQYFPQDELPDLHTFLAAHARLVTETATETFGSVRVYQIDWAS